MTPESKSLARELVCDAIFVAQERRTELRRQAPLSDDPKALYGEVARQEARIADLRALDAELGGARVNATEIRSSIGANMRPETPANPDIFS